MDELTVISHVEVPELEARAYEAVAGVNFVSVPGDAPVPEGLSGEVLLTTVLGGENLQQLVQGNYGIRWVHVMGTGVDQFPIEMVGDIPLTCSRGASAIPIAEWAMAMLLAQAKQLPASWVSQPPADWYFAPLQPLAGKTLGLVGFGSIGQAIARRAQAFDMQVQALVRHPREASENGVSFVDSVPTLMSTSDCVVLAAPATPATHHIIDADALACSKPGLHLVNVARGSLVDEQALREALDNDTLGLASLDVAENEPLPDGHWMYHHPRLRLSPHVSWNDPGAFTRLIDAFIENLARYSKGEALHGLVDTAERY